MSTFYQIALTLNVKSTYAMSVWSCSPDGNVELARSLSLKKAKVLVAHLESVADLESIVELDTIVEVEEIAEENVDETQSLPLFRQSNELDLAELIGKAGINGSYLTTDNTGVQYEAWLTTEDMSILQDFTYQRWAGSHIELQKQYREIERRFRNWISVYEGDFKDINICHSKADFLAAQNGLLIPERFQVKRRYGSQTVIHDYRLVKTYDGDYIYQSTYCSRDKQVDICAALLMLKYVLTRTDVVFSFLNHSTLCIKDPEVGTEYERSIGSKYCNINRHLTGSY